MSYIRYFSFSKILVPFVFIVLFGNLQSKVTIKSIYNPEIKCISLISIALNKYKDNNNPDMHRKLEELKNELQLKIKYLKLEKAERIFLMKYYSKEIEELSDLHFSKELDKCGDSEFNGN